MKVRWVSVSLNPQWYFFGLKIFLIRSAFVVCVSSFQFTFCFHLTLYAHQVMMSLLYCPGQAIYQITLR